MRSSNRSARRRFFHLFLIGALAFASRAPFLLRADRFFDSDEAVEGLMARHVQQGEHPAFLWGQQYKGVPEVYLAAVAFAVTGSGVVPLKAVTLFCFAVFVCAQFLLAERLIGRSIAWLSTAFLLAAPPSLVLWSLSANAEIVMTLLAGTVIILGFDRWRRTGSRRALLVMFAALGFGLWVQRFILYYVAALLWAVLIDLPRRGEVLARLIGQGRAKDEAPGWDRVPGYVFLGGGLLYITLGLAAFLTGGFDVTAGTVRIGIHHPQKLWTIAAALLVIAAILRALALLIHYRASMAAAGAAAVGFVAGYAPALAARGASSPIPRADLHDVIAALSPIGREIVPILLGFRSPTLEWLGVPLAFALVPGVVIVLSVFEMRRRAVTPFFHLLVVVTPVIFLASGAFVDAQSYRYLMPIFGGLAVVFALGIAALFRRSRAIGIVAGVLLIGLFVWEQRAWYSRLLPDTESSALIACMNERGVRYAYADYWHSYKLTFLSQERLIVAPGDGLDRYPMYTAQVHESGSAPTITGRMGNPCISALSSGR